MNVIITGNTKGFGLALTKEFLKAGDNINISSRNKDRVNDVATSLKTQFPKADIIEYPCDVSNPTSTTELANIAMDKWGKIDIWINNAGTSGISRKPLNEVPVDELQLVINTNVLGTLYGCQAALSVMLKQNRGHIFNLAGWGSDGRTSELKAVYGTSKAHIPQLTKTLSKEFKKTNIGIHFLSPGMMMTDLVLQHATPDTHRIFNILCEYPEIIAKKFAPKLRTIKGTGNTVQYISRRGLMLRFMTAWRRKNRFFDEDGNFKPYSE